MADAKIPKKYWWVVAVVVPIVLALIAIVPQLRKPAGGSGGGTTITGGTNTIVYGTNNTFITNVNVFAREYELQTGQPLSDELRKQIEAAVAAAQQNNHAESARLFEQVAKVAPIPAIYNNLGVEYAQTKNVDASERAFQLSKEKLAALTSAGTNSTLPDSAVKPPPVSGPGIRTEASAIPAMTIDPISPPYQAPDEINVVDHGTSLRGAYRVKYQPKAGVTVAMEPGAYDVVLTTGSGAGFVVASNVEVKPGTLTRINPNALVGGIAIEPATKKGFPTIKEVTFAKDRLIKQQTEKLGVTLPLAAGIYDLIVAAAGDQEVHIPDAVTVQAGAIIRLDLLSHLATIVVPKPISGLDMKSIYALNAGTTKIAAKATAWDVPMLVRAGVAYDIALDQAAGLVKIKTGFTPGRGELVEIK
ncbi:MAG TPA: hypothetical protein VJN96_24960 [Vicinamibacterales bacterium]|nr:hypothetical protein [Vicinamibacterales bacterium]